MKQNEFGKRSMKHLKTLDVELQTVMYAALEIIDFSIIEGHRSKAKQNKAYREKRSYLKYPKSKHNSKPSRAVDIIPYPFENSDWNDYKRFYYLAGIVKACAKFMGVNIRWGGDWDSDNNFKDQRFNDLVHFELVD